MITCQDAEHLFGRYLDGELSPSLQTELNAHRLNCTVCQNELAMMEACGDVIGLDRAEPVLSASFTDRVLLAQRSRVMPSPRRWSRVLLLTGSPIAAAACLAFAVLVILPSAKMAQKTSVLSWKIAAPEPIQEYLKATNPGHQLSPAAKQELAQTPEMSADGFLQALLAPLVEKSRDTLEGTRRSAEEFASLVQQGFSDTNDMLVAEWRSAHRGTTSDDKAESERNDLDVNKPAYPNSGARQEADPGSNGHLEPL
jgi:hypothetical protein